MKLFTGTVDLDGKRINRMPKKPDGTWLFQDVKIDGNMFCSECNLYSLEGSPAHITGAFWLDKNPNLHSLRGCTQKIDHNFIAYECRLTSLIGGPAFVNGTYSVNTNKLTNLIGAPEIIYSNFICSYNPLTSLEGCPREVQGNFYARRCGFSIDEIAAVCNVHGVIYA